MIDIENTKLVAVKDLKLGDLVDLEGDQFVSSTNPRFEYEFAEVLEVTPETADCTAVTFDFDQVGFPPDHMLRVLAD